MARIPGSVVRAAAAFGLDPERMRPLGGASGSAWSDGDVVLRVGGRIADEVLALSAAAGRLPVPRVLDRLDLDGVAAVLLERVPGRAAGELASDSPDRAAAIGSACGRLHDALAEVASPPGLRAAPEADGDERRLLHLDLHLFEGGPEVKSPPGAVWLRACSVLFRRSRGASCRLELSRLLNSVVGRQAAR
jgi:hypothetical protein